MIKVKFWEDMPLKSLDGDNRMELNTGFVLIHGHLNGEKMDILKSKWVIVKLILLLFLEIWIQLIFTSNLLILKSDFNSL
jgi:hypothetical protein